ncbi:MAG: restriction endonuclease subunit S, partial [bacterium]|nr:restriction endonuclease subunit S [bacterium]
ALLEQIKAEKARLVKDKKIKKENPLPPITPEEIPYELPEGWVWCRMQNLVSLLGDGIHGTPEYSINSEYYFVNGNNLTDGVIEIKSNTKTVTEKEYIKHRRNLNENTILISINGTIGNTAFYNDEKVMLGKSACYFNLINGIDKYFIRQLLKSNYFLNYAFSSATGTTIKNVSLKTVRSFIVPLPSVHEQKAIVETVNRLMALCDQLEEEVLQSEKQVELMMKGVLREVLG